MTFEYQCNCSYPHGPHTLNCIAVNDRRLEGQTEKVRAAEGDDKALAFWRDGCRVIAAGK